MGEVETGAEVTNLKFYIIYTAISLTSLGFFLVHRYVTLVEKKMQLQVQALQENQSVILNIIKGHSDELDELKASISQNPKSDTQSE